MANDTTNTDTTPPVVKEKRTRTSPRVKFADEVILMMNEHLSDLQEERKETDDSDLVALEVLDAKISLVSDLTLKVQTMSDEGVQKLDYNGRHYIKVDANGVRTAFDSNTVPTVRSHGPGTKHDCVSVLGPFRTESGVAYRIENPTTECPVVF